MKKIFSTMTLMVLGFLAILLLTKQNKAILEHDSLINSLEMNIKTVVFNHFSVGVRVGDKDAIVTDFNNFENDFYSMMDKYVTANLPEEDSMIKYMVFQNGYEHKLKKISDLEADDKVYAVNISYVYGGQEFRMRYVLEEMEPLTNR